MAKFFRIKNKWLRWIAGGVVLLCLLAAIGHLGRLLCFGLGYGLNAWQPSLFSKLVYYRGELTAGVFIRGGAMVLCILLVSLIVICLLAALAKWTGNKLFNSIGDKKVDDKKKEGKSGG